MFLTGSATFMSFAVGTILVVAVAMLGSLTVLPAVLSKLGDRVEKGRVPFVHRLRRGGDGESRVWSAILDRVLRRPLVSAVLAGGLLVALAIPSLRLNTVDSGIEGIPDSLPIMQTYERMQAAFPGGQIPLEVVVQADDVNDPEVVGGDRGPARAGPRDRADERAGRRQRQPGRDGRRDLDPDGGQRHRRHVDQGARRRCATT